MSLASQIASLARRINPNINIPEDWDKNLPLHCLIKLDPETQLLVAEAKPRYVISVITKSTVQSIVVDNINEDTYTILSGNTRPPLHEGAPQRSASGETRARSDAAASHRQPSHSQYSDPNLPPGFEDEHQLSRPAPSGPSLRFDPDSDRLPPGGAYPQLSPMARAPGYGGMNPVPQSGLHTPLHIKYDPTSPFDTGEPSAGLGGPDYPGGAGLKGPGFGGAGGAGNAGGFGGGLGGSPNFGDFGPL